MSQEIQNIKKTIRATNYLTVAQIYLRDNFFLEKELKPSHIKPRLLGHWGTCPGINFIYAHLNNLIRKNKLNMLFVLGPGHGFPALQSNVFLDGTLFKYYKDASLNKQGIEYISKQFSWPYGFPSHASPMTPGVVLEGGELGYSLATAYGTVLDNPDLITACVIGDGEFETGPLATSWHLSKLINSKRDGTVLPIIHLNEFKISGPTFLGRMTDKEITKLLEGYGYEVFIVDATKIETERQEDSIHKEMIKTLDKCLKSIRKIKTSNASNCDNNKISAISKFPVIVLKTLKGWTGIKNLNGEKYEGNYLSHQVVAKNAKFDETELRALEAWLKSYNFNELLTDAGFNKDILDNIPEDGFKMSDNLIAHAKNRMDLNLPDASLLCTSLKNKKSSMIAMGEYLAQVFKQNEENQNFRLMSPDETYSNKLDGVFKSTNRVWMGTIKESDKNMSHFGRVMEMLSEHSLHGLLQGYILSGRHGVFASYEAFMQIVASMADQYSKFLKIAKDISWRGEISSLNYVLTSSLWRQEHNGFSHQNPGFIDTLLQKHNNFVNVFFPADANVALLYSQKMLEIKNSMNVIVAEKTDESIWLDGEEAKEQVKRGIMKWNFASDENPDIVLVGIGQYAIKESLSAIKIMKAETPKIKIRFVCVTELSPYTMGSYTEKMPMSDFNLFFTEDKPVIFNFHGYPETLKQILFDYENNYNRMSVHGYLDSGSTTTPFDLHLRNKTSRYDIVLDAWQKLLESNPLLLDKTLTDLLIKKYNQKIDEAKRYAIDNGVDSPELEDAQ